MLGWPAQGDRMYMHRTSSIIAAFIPVLAFAQVAGTSGPLSPEIQAQAPASISSVLLKHDTPVQLMGVSEITTANVVAGNRFKLRVNQPIVVDGRTIVPIGATAFGTVLTAHDSGGLGKSGEMTTRLLHIQLGDAQIPLEGEQSAKGTGAGSAGVAVLFTGVAGLFHRGNNAKIKAGEIVSGFIAEDVELDLSGPVAKRVENGPVLAPPSS